MMNESEYEDQEGPSLKWFALAMALAGVAALTLGTGFMWGLERLL
jgi:hypothetical protein